MTAPRVLAIIQAGGAGSRMDVLTRERPKPALPIAGIYQLLDLSLSNLSHSGISDVWLSVQYQAAVLEDQVANGRPWDLDRTRGGLRLMVPEQGSGSLDEDGFAHGNADLLFRLRTRIADFAPDVLLVASADHVYRFDFNDILETHLSRKAGCTVLTTTVDPADAGDHATVEADDKATVTGFAYKPENPTTNVVAAEIFAYDPVVLIETLEELHRELSDTTEDRPAGDTGLGDFGEHLLPRLVDRGQVVAHPLTGYWRDLGEPRKYLQAHQDLLTDDVGVFGELGWPILTQPPQRVPARLLDGATVTDSLISPGSRVSGWVHRSVLGPGVVVEAGAMVSNSVVFADTVIKADATVHWSIIDSGCTIGSGARVGDAEADALGSSDAVTLVGQDSQVAAEAVIPAGSRLEPGTTT
ncbi:glucose-1-phosphate adenylyltransferase family protein [Nocardioides sp.]|uniref:glucose-1-phosphate adenylyltransferase family protein n=1 Tax=Nocardioides sp. TaxID=35761 RepID=UPI003D0D2E65